MSESISAKTRVLKDIREILEISPLDKDGIFIYVDESNYFNVKALIIGPKDTPYEGGFYFFDIVFPKDYPLSPPHVIHMTRTGTVRFNPNLYVDGKICLSIINTWAGPSWTPCITLSAVLMSIRGMVLNECPLVNEPGCENLTRYIYDNYNTVIAYHNLWFSVLTMLSHPIPGFDVFQITMTEYFLKNRTSYLKRAQKLSDGFPNDTLNICTSYEMKLIRPNPSFQQLYIDMVNIVEEMSVIHPNLLSVEDDGGASSTATASDATSPSTIKPVHTNKSMGKLNCSELRSLARDHNITTTKPHHCTGKSVNKTKNELIEELLLVLN